MNVGLSVDRSYPAITSTGGLDELANKCLNKLLAETYISNRHRIAQGTFFQENYNICDNTEVNEDTIRLVSQMLGMDNDPSGP